jgi:hypothetical protein
MLVQIMDSSGGFGFLSRLWILVEDLDSSTGFGFWLDSTGGFGSPGYGF